MAAASRTIDHQEIRRWVEAHDGRPVAVKRARGKEAVGMLRLDFAGASINGSVEPLGWDEWLAKFDEQQLALVYREGKSPRLNKLVPRDAARAHRSAPRAAAPAPRRGRPSTAALGTRTSPAKRHATTKAPRGKPRGSAAHRSRRTSSRTATRTTARTRPSPEMTKAQLYGLARSAGVRKRSGMSKAELLRALAQRR